MAAKAARRVYIRLRFYTSLLRPFRPCFKNPHLATLAGNFWRREIDESRFPTREVLYDTEPETRVLVHENRPAGEVKGEVFLHHGLEGSSRSGYMVSLAQALCEAGYAAHRINMRGCGGTEHLTATLYHSGLTQDVREILLQTQKNAPAPRFVIGFSLGGNVALKLAGELGETDLVSGVAAVSTPIDLHECVRMLGAKQNWMYEQRFVRSLRARYYRRHQAHPHRFPVDGLHRTKSVFEFDDRFTAKAFGFGDAPNYYRTQSALGFLPRIRVQTLLVQAVDDPLIPFAIYRHKAIRENPALQLAAIPNGGHLGFIARGRPRFWLDDFLIEWLESRRNNHPFEIVLTDE